MRLLALTLVALLTGCLQVKHPNRDIPNVTASDLLDSPEKYAGMTVVATGYWNQGFELSSFSDESNSAVSDIWVQTEGAALSEETSPAIQTALQEARTLVRCSPYPQIVAARTQIKCEGRFDHAKDGAGKNGYGHMGEFPSQLTITRILEATIVPNN